MHKNKLHILYHFRVRGTGAEGVHIAGIVNGFRALGHSVDLISPTNTDPTRPITTFYQHSLPWFKILLHKLADHAPQPAFEIMEIFYNLYASMRLLRHLMTTKKDFIYERYAFFNFSGALAAKIKRLPFVVEVNELSGHKRVRSQYFVRFCSAIEKYVLRQADLVITVSDFLHDEVSSQVDGKKTRVVTIANGVPLDWFDYQVSNEQVAALRSQFNLDNKKVLCFVGGLVHWHNFDLLLQAFRNVHMVDANVVLLLIGEGPMRQYIVEKRVEYDLPEEVVVLIGSVMHAEVPLYLQLADVAIIPETNEFRSPIKMFEYMAMGLPVVAPKKPAIETLVEDLKEGFLFEPGDSASLTKAVLNCLDDRDRAREMGRNGKLKVRNNFTWERHAEEIIKAVNWP